MYALQPNLKQREFLFHTCTLRFVKSVVTCAGNSGIGVETVRALATAGARVVFTSRSLAAGEEVAASLRKDSRVKANPGHDLMSLSRS